jgi:hypothetical protein
MQFYVAQSLSLKGDLFFSRIRGTKLFLPVSIQEKIIIFAALFSSQEKKIKCQFKIIYKARLRETKSLI